MRVRWCMKVKVDQDLDEDIRSRLIAQRNAWSLISVCRSCSNSVGLSHWDIAWVIRAPAISGRTYRPVMKHGSCLALTVGAEEQPLKLYLSLRVL